MFPLLKKVETELAKIPDQIRVSVMGCVVNGPGEAAVADVGVAGGRGIGLIYRGDKVVKKVKEEEIFDALMEEVNAFLAEKKQAPVDAAPVA
jgi:(E)-4-hydroxy-3-methylbut-2-enyl-diphosphate synthase